jgi:hypothetical protein
LGCKRRQQVGRLIVVSKFFSLVAKDNDELGFWLVVILGCFSSIIEDGSSTCHCLLLFSSSIEEDDNKLGSWFLIVLGCFSLVVFIVIFCTFSLVVENC